MKNNIRHCSRYLYHGAVFAERFKRTIIDPLKRPVFEKRDGNWIDVLPTKAKQINNQVVTSTTLKPIQASLKKNEGHVYRNLLDKTKKNKPKFQLNHLVRTADLKRTFSKRVTTIWSNKLYKITEIIDDTS